MQRINTTAYVIREIHNSEIVHEYSAVRATLTSAKMHAFKNRLFVFSALYVFDNEMKLLSKRVGNFWYDTKEK